MKTYQCIVYGFIYDEAKGMPEDGIPAGTLWDDVPACRLGMSRLWRRKSRF